MRHCPHRAILLTPLWRYPLKIQRIAPSAILFGFVAAICGTGVARYYTQYPLVEEWHILPYLAWVCCWISGSFLWQIVIIQPQRFSILRGVLVGFLTVMLSLFLIWYLWIWIENFSYWILKKPASSLGEPPVDPLYGIIGALGLSWWSLLLTGKVAIPLAALLGGMFAYVHDRIKSQSK